MFIMSLRSPFSFVSDLPALVALRRAGASVQNAGTTKRTHSVIAGLVGASRSLVAGELGLARTAENCCSVVLIVVDGPEAALDTLADLRTFIALQERSGQTPSATTSLPEKISQGAILESSLFPAWDVLPTESDRPEGLTLAGRLKATGRLRELRMGRMGTPGLPNCYFLVAPMIALLQPCEAPEAVTPAIVLKAGTEHDPILLGRRLNEVGYDRVGQVEVRGEYALRGGILDIFPYTAETPYRIDFLGDKIESIKPFDPLTQCSDDEVAELSFADASPLALKKLFTPETESKAGTGPASVLDHLPPGTLLVWQDPARLWERSELYRASLVSGRSFSFDFESLRKDARKKFDSIEFRGESAGANNAEDVEDVVIELACTTLQRVHGDISVNCEAWKKLVSERQQVLVFCETVGHLQRLRVLFQEAGVPVDKSPRSPLWPKGVSEGDERRTKCPPLLPLANMDSFMGIQLVSGKLSGGFDLREVGLAAISDREILGQARHAAASASPPKRKQIPGTVAIQHLIELKPGDHVVHAAHGIARYLGLARLEKSGRTEDYLTLLFANEVKLYVPAAHIGWVGRYIGGHANLELSTLGSKVWARKKERATKAIQDIAEDLLRVQAARKSLPGIVYPPDGEWQGPFEKAFPFQETPDQLSAIEAVKTDMEGTCPMDRLLCGDVGFGKTEVALRAAFKAASAGKQVALLAPTTLLVEQHGRTFKDRFAGYPLVVEVLSRFKRASEQKRLLNKLATGRVDVVIGTHRLIQKDVRFKDLGLAIIDEEQRFGVEHKEFFKQLRKSVDVLTLTATPIPRTLHMALLGLRDISNLTTPPRNRRSIVTKVARLSEDLLRRAILREISRGGQVFIVHPRVYDIDEFKQFLARVVPEARFAIGHGQMDADELEAVMGAFLHGEVDVLVSTTIVESGLDIPSANTILIHEADRFGLAELHQLRGRVGRSDLQAYCYLLLPERSELTAEGLRRLRALEEFDELGAGFQLALKDLEIRGAGNVLGKQQSGEIAEVGYDLYCKLMDAAVKSLKGEKTQEEIEVNLQLAGAAYIPDEYVQDDKAVLEIYRRLDAAQNDSEIDQLKTQILDRFGPLPMPAARMFEETKLRRLARLARIPYVGVDETEQRVIMKLHEWDLKAADRALRGVAEVKGVRVIDGETLSFGLTLKSKHDEGALRELVRRLLEPLAHVKSRL